MRELKWNESYSVGVKRFDDQHQLVIGVLNRVFKMFETDSPPEELATVLGELAEYAQKHFSSEEQLMEKYKFHGLEGHIAEHRLYESKIAGFKDGLGSEDEKVRRDVLEFLADWWMGHIQGCDKEYTRFLNNCGVF